VRGKGLDTQTRDARGRRRQMIAITAEGQENIDDNTAQAAEIVVGFKAKLGEAQYEQLLDLLAKLDPNAAS